jgi:hypothetical protein
MGSQNRAPARHSMPEFNQGPVFPRLRAPLGTVLATRLYGEMPIIAVDEP